MLITIITTAITTTGALGVGWLALRGTLRGQQTTSATTLAVAEITDDAAWRAQLLAREESLSRRVDSLAEQLDKQRNENFELRRRLAKVESELDVLRGVSEENARLKADIVRLEQEKLALVVRLERLQHGEQTDAA